MVIGCFVVGVVVLQVVGDIEDGWQVIGGFDYFVEVEYVYDQVVVVELCIVFVQDDFFVVCFVDFGDDVGDLGGVEELWFFDVDCMVGLCDGYYQIGLVCQECGDLQYVYYVCYWCGLGNFMDVGDYWYVEVVFDFFEDVQVFVQVYVVEGFD